jgi:hypothetical protein
VLKGVEFSPITPRRRETALARPLRMQPSKKKRRKAGLAMKLSFVPLLLGAKTLSVEAKTALRENRREDAAALLMQQYDLDCHEAGELVDASVCDGENGK